MSLSTCPCGGHIPLGPDATNCCDRCGLPVFADPQPAAKGGGDPLPLDLIARKDIEINGLRAQVAELIRRLDEQRALTREHEALGAQMLAQVGDLTAQRDALAKERDDACRSMIDSLSSILCIDDCSPTPAQCLDECEQMMMERAGLRRNYSELILERDRIAKERDEAIAGREEARKDVLAQTGRAVALLADMQAERNRLRSEVEKLTRATPTGGGEEWVSITTLPTHPARVWAVIWHKLDATWNVREMRYLRSEWALCFDDGDNDPACYGYARAPILWQEMRDPPLPSPLPPPPQGGEGPQ